MNRCRIAIDRDGHHGTDALRLRRHLVGFRDPVGDG